MAKRIYGCDQIRGNTFPKDLVSVWLVEAFGAPDRLTA